MGNKEWNKSWKSYINDLNRLRLVNSEDDSQRIVKIIEELNIIVDRNTNYKEVQ